MFGTFLNRSGVVESIHSFAKSSIGGWFLGFVIVTTLFSLTLILWRLPLLQARTKLESPISREAVFLYNNLLLVALCLADLLGRDLPDHLAALERHREDVRRLVLRLLPADLRAAAAAPDGYRPARRLAAFVGTRPRAHAPLADRRLGHRRRRPDRASAPARRFRASSATRSASSCSPRSSSSSSAAPARRARSSCCSSAIVGATAATSSTSRSCCSRSGSSARAPTGRRRRSR